MGSLAPGSMVFERYWVERPLGVGGMGAVYLARDRKLANRPIALKEVLLAPLPGEEEEEAADRLAGEAAVLAGLIHPGVPQVYDHFVEQGRYYVAMEYVAGSDLTRALSERAERTPRLADSRAVIGWGVQICQILEYLHGQRPPIVHGDIKPENLLLTPDGRIKLIDFGVVGRVKGEGRLGTAGYAPPEQYDGDMEPRSDLYSLGVTLHQLLTGHDPQCSPTFNLPPVDSIRPDLEPGLAALLQQMLSSRVTGRPATAEKVRLRLEQQLRTGRSGEAGRPCPICGSLVRQGLRYCALCRVDVTLSHPPLRVEGRPAHLPITVPPAYWRRLRAQWLPSMCDDGGLRSVVLLATVQGQRGEYAFIVWPPPGRAGEIPPGTQVIAYSSARNGDDWTLTAVSPDQPALHEEVVKLWQSLSLLT